MYFSFASAGDLPPPVSGPLVGPENLEAFSSCSDVIAMKKSRFSEGQVASALR